MNVSSNMKNWLENCDIKSIRKFWRRLNPNLPQPEDDEQTLISIHIARTQSYNIDFNKRAYSHRWLVERNLPSMLPDELRLKAERVYPKVVECVGISVNSASSMIKPAIKFVEKDICNAVSEIYVDDPKPAASFVKSRILEVKNLSMLKLFGIR